MQLLPVRAHIIHTQQPARAEPPSCTDRKEGGVGDLAYPLVSDLKREISSKYYVLTRDGVALRGLFIIDKEVCACAAGATASLLRSLHHDRHAPPPPACMAEAAPCLQGAAIGFNPPMQQPAGCACRASSSTPPSIT